MKILDVARPQRIVPKTLKEGRSPVTDTVTYHIYEDIAEGDNPQKLVLEHVVHEEHLERKLVSGRALALHSAVVISVFLD